MKKLFLAASFVLFFGATSLFGAEYVLDGGFEGFGETTLPDVGADAGAWRIATYGSETVATDIQIGLRPDSATDHALHLGGTLTSGFYAAGQPLSNAGQITSSRLVVSQERYIASAGSLGAGYTLGSGDMKSLTSNAVMVIFGHPNDLTHIQYYAGGAYHAMAPFSEGHWYEFRTDLNMDGSKNYDVYLRSETDSRYQTWTQIGYKCDFVGSPSTSDTSTWWHQIGNFGRSPYSDDVYVDNVSATDDLPVAGETYFTAPGSLVIDAAMGNVYQNLDTIINTGSFDFSANITPSNFATTGSSSLFYLGDSRIGGETDFDTGTVTDNWTAAVAAFGFEQTDTGLMLQLIDGAGDGTVAQTLTLDAGLQNDQTYRVAGTVHYEGAKNEQQTWSIQVYDSQDNLLLEKDKLGFLSNDTSVLRLACQQNSLGTESVTLDDISLAVSEVTHNQVAPTAVVLASGEVPEGYEVEKLYDGDLSTFSVVRDDTLDGTDDTTSPAYAVSPTTGHLVFDLGEAMTIDSVEMFSRISTSSASTPSDVDFFYYADDDPTNNAVADDIEGDEDIILLTNDQIDSIINGESWVTEWDEITARYIGMRINGSQRDTEGQTSFNFQLAEVLFSSPIPNEEEPIPGDANGDGKVDGSDVTILAGNWQKGVSDGQTARWEEGDFNGDGKVDGSDVTILAGNWQYGVTAAANAVPEPSSVALLLMLTLGLAGLRYKK